MLAQTIKVPANGTEPEFLIQYQEGANEILIDGVRVSIELFRVWIVSPREDRWIRFERKDGVVIAHSVAVPTEDASDPWAWRKAFEVPGVR